MLRVTERARSVVHVPRVLYHWRMLDTSAAGGGEAVKPWAFEAGKRAVQAHCEPHRTPGAGRARRATIRASTTSSPTLQREPTVSIVIPTNGQSREVRFEQVILVVHCVRSIVERSTYENYEIVVVYDDSTARRARSIYGRSPVTGCGRSASRGLSTSRRRSTSGPSHSEGDHLLLLNDDMEVATPDWIERMVMYSSHAEIGAVGARLLYEDGRLQHTGVFFPHGLPGHLYRGYAGDFRGYSNNVVIAQNFLSVTGACLMTPREAVRAGRRVSVDFPSTTTTSTTA